MALLRTLYRSSSIRSSLHPAVVANRIFNSPICHESSRTFFSLSSNSTSPPLKRVFYDSRSPFGMVIGSIRTFSKDMADLPDIKDPEIKNVFKDFMAADWSELPEALTNEAAEVLSKDTNDTEGKDALKKIVSSAVAIEEFSGTLKTLKMALDDSVGLSGENVKPLSKDLVDALKVAYERYMKYLDSFSTDELYLKKKVESQLGTKMIHLKMRCSGLGSEWGKVTVLGTSGISGSYIEQRGP